MLAYSGSDDPHLHEWKFLAKRHFSWMMEGLMDGKPATEYFMNFAFDKSNIKA